MVIALLLLLFTTLAPAQDSQFLFDVNGNLQVQAPAINAAPQITRQPQNSVVETGETASFAVIATGTKPLSYEWRFNNTNIGATAQALLLLNVGTNSEGQYSVVVSNAFGSVTSAPALLIIDSDGDGMGDSWEVTFFGNLNQNATADFDHDGVSNLREFLDGTDPADPNSFACRLTVISDLGSVSKTPNQTTYTNGQAVTITAIPPTNGLFYAWLGDIVTRTNPVTLVMTNDKTVYARFTPIVLNWTNLFSGDWDTATNWSPNLAPGSNDTAVILNTVSVTLNTPADLGDFTLGSAASGPTLTGSGTLTVRGAFVWVSGNMGGSGSTILEPGATLSLDNPGQVGLSRTLENGGTVFWTAVGTIGMSTGAVITNRPGALFHVQNAGSFVFQSGSPRFDNAGTVRKSETTNVLTVPSGMTFNNYGTAEIQSGTLRLAGGGSSSGILATTNTTLVEWTGGTFTLNAGAQLNGAGLYRISTTVTANTNIVVPNLDMISGTLGGTGAVTISNAMNWTGGAMSGSGRTIIAPGVTLTLSNAAAASLSGGRTLENGGTLLLKTGAGGIGLDTGAVITNRAGALFDYQSAASFGSLFTGNRIDNAGTFRKSVSTGALTVPSSLSFNNSGTVEIQAGTLSLAGGGAHSGSFTVPAGTELILSGGTHTAVGSSSITGAGQLTVSGATATLGGLVNVSGSNIFSSGTANLTGNYICTNNTLTISGGTANFDGSGTISPAVALFSNGTLGGSNLVTVGSLMNWTSGLMSGSGRTIILPAATLNLSGASGVTLSRTLENGGTVLWTGAGGIGMGVITNRAGALFDVRNAASLSFASGARFDNAGTFRKSANAGTTSFGSAVSFNNSGTVEIQTGTLLCNGSFTNNGAVNLSAGTTNRLASGGAGRGAFTTPTTAMLEWTGGAFTLIAGAQLNGAGLYRINNGTVTANTTLPVANLDLFNGTLDGSGTVTISNAMNWTGGIMGGSGRTIIPAGVTLNAAIPSVAFLTSRTLENGGTVLWTGAGVIQISSGAVITNRPTGLFHAQNAASFLFGGGASRFDNAGTFRKSVSVGSTTVPSGVTFANYGTVDIRSGILAANGGYASSPNGLLNCALGGTTAGTNYGQLQVAGTLTLNGGLSVDLLPGFSPATNDTFTVLTAGTRSGTFASFSYPSNRVTLSLSNSPTSVILRATDVLPIPQPVLLTPQLLGSNALLTWTATSNVTYRLENNGDLGSTNWTAVAGDVTTFSNTASKLDTLTPSNRFYRVRAFP
ncbi:MAG: hypothetical protein HY299_02595 [Verrucomicrobia bacterium]|nr:hypothetical protein [Verrucomicrobiota bacterium]